ncbi:MAG: serine/threonine-protein kinase [Kofleriaceae bacterium]
MEGQTIGQYRVTGLIGQGGMGAVYAGEHTLLGRPAAIKVLLPELSQKQDIVMRFFNEARAATAIRHPGIVEIYDFGWTPEGAAFIVMEHLQGETLARRAARGQLPWGAALAITRQIAGALGAAHGKGIVHRDLKPDNIFLVLDPEVPGGERIKLLDFGIAKLAGDATTTAHVTKTGAVMGTPTYMAPEQCRGVVVDHRADLYALGCIVFELCTGQPPFQGEGTGDVIGAHIHVPPPTLGALDVRVPPAVELLVARLLMKAPAQRVQTADELIRGIDAIVGGRGSGPMVTSASARPAPAAPSMTTLSGAATTSESHPMPMLRGRRSRVLAIGAGVVAAMVVVALVVVATGTSDPARPGVTSRSTAAMRASSPTTPVTVAPDPAPAPALPAAAPAAPTTAPAAPDPAPAPAAPDPAPTPAPPDPAATPAAPTPAAQPLPKPVARPTPPPAAPVGDAKVDIDLDSVPAGAQVLLGGVVVGKTPFRGTLPRRPGDSAMVIRLEGYADRRVMLRADAALHERIKLVRLPPPTTKPSRKDRDKSVNPFAE